MFLGELTRETMTSRLVVGKYISRDSDIQLKVCNRGNNIGIPQTIIGNVAFVAKTWSTSNWNKLLLDIRV